MHAPKLRFKEFKEDWRNKLLEELADVRTGDKDTQNRVENGIYPFFVRSQTVERINSYSHDGEAVLTSGDGVGVGKNFHYIDGKFDYHQRVYCISNFKNTVFGKYVFFYFSEKFNKRVMGLSAKNSVDSVRRSMITEMPIKIPSITEQTKIANFLTAVDEKISQLNQKHDLLSQYKNGVMQQIFSQELRFQDDDGGDFPEWEESTLGEVCDIKRGASPRPIADKKWFSDDSAIGWVRISDVSKSSKYLTKTEQYLSEAGVRKSRLVKKGNIIMSICATIGKPIYTNFDVCIHDGFVVFENLQIGHEYLYYYLMLIEKNWYKYGQPGSQVNLNSDIVSNETIPIPDIKEQTKIANFLTAIDYKITATQAELNAVKQYKQGLLQQMFD
jgi:type I restriction enzyme S subunit